MLIIAIRGLVSLFSISFCIDLSLFSPNVPIRWGLLQFSRNEAQRLKQVLDFL